MATWNSIIYIGTRALKSLPSFAHYPWRMGLACVFSFSEMSSLSVSTIGNSSTAKESIGPEGLGPSTDFLLLAPRGSKWIICAGDYVDNSFTALGSSDPREVRLELLLSFFVFNFRFVQVHFVFC